MVLWSIFKGRLLCILVFTNTNQSEADLGSLCVQFERFVCVTSLVLTESLLHQKPCSLHCHFILSHGWFCEARHKMFYK